MVFPRRKRRGIRPHGGAFGNRLCGASRPEGRRVFRVHAKIRRNAFKPGLSRGLYSAGRSRQPAELRRKHRAAGRRGKHRALRVPGAGRIPGGPGTVPSCKRASGGFRVPFFRAFSDRKRRRGKIFRRQETFPHGVFLPAHEKKARDSDGRRQACGGQVELRCQEPQPLRRQGADSRADGFRQRRLRYRPNDRKVGCADVRGDRAGETSLAGFPGAIPGASPVFSGKRASAFRSLPGRHVGRELELVPFPSVLFPEHQDAASHGSGAGGGGSFATGPERFENRHRAGGGLCAPDSGMAGVCPGDLLGAHAGIQGHELFQPQAQTPGASTGPAGPA